MTRWRMAAITPWILALCAVSPSVGEEAAVSLPDPRGFLEEVRRNLRSDETLLDQYTFIETFTEKRLDGKGRIKSVRTETYEVYPSLEPGEMYRRLVARDGTRLSPEELAAQDRRQESQSSEASRKRRAARQEEQRREEKAVVDELFRMDEIAIAGRESIDGRPAIVVRFAPRAGFRPTTDGGKVIRKLAGRAWVDEEDRQLVRLEANLLDSMGVGPAGIARLQKGSTASFQRRKVNGEIWLPSEAHFSGEAKILLIFGTRLDVLSRYGDYKKFTVGTEEEIRSSH